MTRLARSTRSLRTFAALGVVLVLGVTAACGPGDAQWNSPTGAGGTETASPPPGDSAFTVSLEAGAKDVSPAEPVTVSITNGTLSQVKLVDEDGREVKGELNAGGTSWQTTQRLEYNNAYTLTSAGRGLDGRSFDDSRTFSTMKVAKGKYIVPYLRANVGTLLDGGTFGVGQPIVVWFDEPIREKDRAKAERSLTVTTDPPGIVGAWRWASSQEVHWRPKEYWPSGTKVTVEADLFGKSFAGGLYGDTARTASFTIGKKKIAIADSKTHRMKVYIDDKLVTKINGHDTSKGIPISMGKGGTERGANGQIISFTTNSGPHVVTQKYEVYRMTSASFGITDKNSPNYYDEKIKKSIRISGDGEFVHLADWNIWAHGKVNTSHGCINVAPTYIYWFYDTFGAGDVVDVTNTSRKLDWRNGLGDWVLPWDEWVKGSALS